METWRKSTHSDVNGGDCVEVADTPGTVMVRDTTDRQGPMLNFQADAWSRFIATL